jgi:hypothetical protein
MDNCDYNGNSINGQQGNIVSCNQLQTMDPTATGLPQVYGCIDGQTYGPWTVATLLATHCTPELIGKCANGLAPDSFANTYTYSHPYSAEGKYTNAVGVYCQNPLGVGPFVFMLFAAIACALLTCGTVYSARRLFSHQSEEADDSNTKDENAHDVNSIP